MVVARRKSGRLRISAAVVALLVAVPACSRGGDESRRGDAPPPGAALPCGKETPITGREGDGIAPSGAFVSPTSEFESLWLWGHRVAYTSDHRWVVVCDLRTGDTRVVATVDRARKYLGTVRAHGDRIVWAEFDNPEVPDEPSAGTAWTIMLHDLRTGRTTTVADGRPRLGRFTAPEPQVEGSVIVWLDLPPGDPTEQGPQLVSQDLVTGARRVLAAGTFPWSPRISDGQVYFSAKTDGGRDLHSVAADGSSAARRLTSEGGVDELDARNGWVTWARFSTDPDPNRTIGDVPIVVLRAGSTSTRVVASGEDPVAGAGFVVANSVERGGEIFGVKADGSGLSPVATEGGPAWTAGWSVDGDRLVWATVDNPDRHRKPAYLRIGRMFPTSGQ